MFGMLLMQHADDYQSIQPLNASSALLLAVRCHDECCLCRWGTCWFEEHASQDMGPSMHKTVCGLWNQLLQPCFAIV